MLISYFVLTQRKQLQSNMKFLITLFAVISLTAADYAPITYPAYAVAPWIYGAHSYAAAPYIASGYAAPINRAAYVAAVAPIQSGYVAQTRGSLHIAPHPEGPFTASHHINTAPAPGTY